MKPSVADKTPIPAKIWRRHTDPPHLWIYLAIASVSLHLLVFWLMRSSSAFNLWFPQQSQSAIPIELIDIAPQTKSTTKSQLTAKTVSPKRLSSIQKSIPTRTTPKNQDFGAINSTDRLQIKRKTEASQTNKQRFGQKTIPKPIPKPKPIVSQTNKQRFRQKTVPKPIPTAMPTPKSTVPVGNLPWNPRPKIPLGKETPLPTGIPSKQPVKETPPTPTRETPPTPTGKTSPISTQGTSVATVTTMSRDEVNSLIKAGRLRQDAPPDKIAAYQGSKTKQLDPSFLPQDFGLKPAKLLASLVIDRNGKFQQAFVLEIEPATLQSEKSTYEQVLNEIFKTENFLAAENNDGTKPPLSNLDVWIKVEPANSK
ncbi:hypothetical protein [Nostoc sp. C117]|uniref:hypothetical protein n=1 Tax=Nostoc sp. C117 TaxID=3349875 RepID=UPI00370D2858